MTLVAAVGTFIAGFDELVLAADRTCTRLGLPGFAQIGHSTVEPHAMRWERFLPQDRLVAAFRDARVVVCHAGMGIVGEAMRAGAPIVLFPRRGTTRRDHPANDQAEFARTIAARHGLAVCERADDLPEIVVNLLRDPGGRAYAIDTDIPAILGRWLTEGSGSPG